MIQMKKCSFFRMYISRVVELTAGWILTIISALGIIGCLAALIATIKIFPRQRRELLEEIEEEWEGKR